jgi:hypothetical protein
MIFDAHTHVGDFGPMFNVSLDRDGLAALIEEHEYEGCCVFHPDNEYVRTVVESIPEAYGLVWANPKVPGYLEEAERFLEHPKFLGLKLHPLIDGYLPKARRCIRSWSSSSSEADYRSSSIPATRSSRCRGRSRSWRSPFPV